MKTFKLFLIFLMGVLFITSCDTLQSDEISYTKPYPVVAQEGVDLAKDNFDLQVVGSLLERADDAEEFERLLNTEGGVNNLDLNYDGYADYISVSEYDDRYSDQRGFILYDRFGDDDVQEICRVYFVRDYYDAPGARVLLYGNDEIYGDNYYYETNWLEKSLVIADWIFTDREVYYYSPYYYDHYPDYYDVYTVVETPFYRTRIEEYYYEPIFTYTTAPTIFEVNNIKIKSRYDDRSSERVLANLVKPTQEQINYKQKNLNSEVVETRNRRVKESSARAENRSETRGDKGRNKSENFRNEGNEKSEMRNNSERVERGNNKSEKVDRTERGNPNKAERTERGNPNKAERVERGNNKPNKVERVERNSPKPNRPERVERPNVQQNRPARVERPNVRMERPNNVKMERPNKVENRPSQPNRPTQQVKQNGGGQNPNKGTGGNKPAGGNKPTGGGKGKIKP